MHPCSYGVTAVVEFAACHSIERFQDRMILVREPLLFPVFLYGVLAGRKSEDDTIGDHGRFGQAEIAGNPPRFQHRILSSGICDDLERHDAAPQEVAMRDLK